MSRVLLQSVTIAIVVFVVAFIWLSAWRSFHPINPPNEPQRQENTETKNQDGNEGKGFFERTTEDPVAFFTLWLTLFTGILAAFTIWMALSTKDLRDFAEEQSRDMKSALAESKRSADAAKDAADAAKQASDATTALERPYFFVTGKFVTTGANDPGPHVNFSITNIGRVPGIVRMVYAECSIKAVLESQPIYHKSKFRTALSAVTAGNTLTDSPPATFDRPLTPEDYAAVAANTQAMIFQAIIMYEGPLDYTYAVAASYKIDPATGFFYPIGGSAYNYDSSEKGRGDGKPPPLPKIIE